MSMLMRREPRDVFAVPSIFDRFFSEPFAGLATIEEGNLALDVSEDEKNVIVRASLPGFKKDDIEVELAEGVLTIKAARTEEEETKNETFYRKERRSQSVSRRIALPTNVSEAQGDAELKDGVLTLRFPKTPESQPKKLKIR